MNWELGLLDSGPSNFSSGQLYELGEIAELFGPVSSSVNYNGHTKWLLRFFPAGERNEGSFFQNMVFIY